MTRVINKEGRAPRLWTKNYTLLWQGSFVSTLGDVVYEIALGFWVLAATGSTALMGGLMAASTVPRVLLSPFSGVIVDRMDRKRILVLTDAVRGAVVVAVGIAAILGVAEVWMVFAAGIIIGICASLFNPAISAIIPDIVHRERIMQANSFFSMIRAGTGVVGNSGGGVLYSLLGAPVMFLANGISYLLSAASELFISLPRKRSGVAEDAGGNVEATPTIPVAKSSFFADLRIGARFVWGNRGVRFLMTTAAVINFLAAIAIVLLIAFFQRTSFLGPARYGVGMATFTFGLIAGMGATAAFKIPPHRQLTAFSLSTVVFVVFFGIFPQWNSFIPMLVCLLVGGFFNAVVNVLIQSVFQLSVPANLRGKVFGLLDSLTAGLMPVGMAVGGVLGEFLPIKWIITGAFVLIGVYVFPQLASPSLRHFFNLETVAEPAAGKR